jgi:hypothetical protein
VVCRSVPTLPAAPVQSIGGYKFLLAGELVRGSMTTTASQNPQCKEPSSVFAATMSL